MALDEVIVGAYDDGVLDKVPADLVLFLDTVVLVGVGILRAVFRELHGGLGLLILEEALQRRPRVIFEIVLLAQGVDDDVEGHKALAFANLGQRVYLSLALHACEDAVASQCEVLRAEGLCAVLFSLQQGAELPEVGTAHEGRVGDGEAQRHRGVARVVRVLVELHRLQVGLVLECLLGKGRGAGRLVGTLLLSGVDDGVGHVVAHLLHVSVIDQVLLRRGDDVATADESHLVDVRQDVLAHALVHGVGIVRAAAAPALRGDEAGGGGGRGHWIDSVWQCLNTLKDVCRLRGYRALDGYGAPSLLGRLPKNLTLNELGGSFSQFLSGVLEEGGLCQGELSSSKVTYGFSSSGSNHSLSIDNTPFCQLLDNGF